jgi:hypothetical protein
MPKPTFHRITLSGTATLIDQRGDPTRGDVEGTEVFKNANDEVTSVKNWRSFDAALAFYLIPYRPPRAEN